MKGSQLEEDPIRGMRRIARIGDTQDQSPRKNDTSVLLVTKKAIFVGTSLNGRRINRRNPKKLEMQQWYWMDTIKKKSVNYFRN